MDYGYLLENPRKRRRGRRKKTSSRRRRRTRTRRRRSRSVTVAVAANPSRRRRRRTRSRTGSPFGRRRRRKNPFGLGGGGGGIMPTVKRAIGLTLGEVIGDALTRAVTKFTPLGRMALAGPALRIGVGLFAGPLLKMARVPQNIRSDFGAVNVASGIIGLTQAMRQRAFSAVGLSDYELADYELADYELAGAPPAGMFGAAPPAGMFGQDDEEITLLDGYSEDCGW